MLAGADRGYRATLRDPNGKLSTIMKIGTTASMSMALYGMNKFLANQYADLKDEDGRKMVDFNDLPQWTKTAYWHWYIPTETDPTTGRFTKFTHLHMPKLWEVGSVATLAELATESMIQGSDDDKVLIQDALQVLAGNFNLHIVGEGFPFPLPAGVDMLAEQHFNKVLFTGNPIETAGMSDMLPWARARSSQPEVFKKWGELFSGEAGEYTHAWIQSPARAEALLRGFFGNWTMTAAMMVDSLAFPGGPMRELDQYPIWRRVYSSAGRYDKNVSKFYDNLRDFNQAYGTLRHLAKKGDVEQLTKMSLDPDQMDLVSMQPGFDRMKRRIGLFNAEIDLIRRGTAMPLATPREKASAINRLESERNMLMKEMNRVADYIRKNS
jgi:hypothetical protein